MWKEGRDQKIIGKTLNAGMHTSHTKKTPAPDGARLFHPWDEGLLNVVQAFSFLQWCQAARPTNPEPNNKRVPRLGDRLMSGFYSPPDRSGSDWQSPPKNGGS